MLNKTLRGAIAVCTAAALLLGGAGAANADPVLGQTEDTSSATNESTSTYPGLDESGASTRAILPPFTSRVFAAIAPNLGARHGAYLPAGDGTPPWLLSSSPFLATVAAINPETGRSAHSAINGFDLLNGVAIAPGSTSSSGIIYIGQEGSVRVFDVARGNFSGPNIPVPLLNTGALAVVGGDSVGTGILYVADANTAKVLGIDLKTREVVKEFPLPPEYRNVGLALGADASLNGGSLLLAESLGTGGRLARLDTVTGEITKVYQVLPAIRESNRSVTVIPGGAAGEERVLMTGGSLSKVVEYDLATESVVQEYVYDESVGLTTNSPVDAVNYDPNTDRVYVYKGAEDVGVFDRTTGELIDTFETFGNMASGLGTTGADAGDGNAILYAGELSRGIIHVYDTKTQTVLKRLPIEDAVRTVTVVEGDTPRLVVYTTNAPNTSPNRQTLEFRDIDTGALIRSKPGIVGDYMTPVPTELTGGASKVLVTTSATNTLRMVNADTGDIEWTKTLPFSTAGTAFKVGATLAESLIYVASPSGKVEALNAETRESVGNYTGFAWAGIRAVAVRSNGQLLVQSKGYVEMVDPVSKRITGEQRLGFDAKGAMIMAENTSTGDTEMYAMDALMGMMHTTIYGLSIQAKEVPDGVVGAEYEFEINAHGDPAPTLTLEGKLPAGLKIDLKTGIISGTPTESGTFEFTLKAQNGVAADISKKFTLFVGETPVITTESLAEATVGTAYDATIEATGVKTPTLSITDGALPAGLSFDQATGKITGTPTVDGAFTIEATATNSSGSVAKTFSLVVKAAKGVTVKPVITTKSLPDGKAGKAYTATVVATGVEKPTLSLSGKLPAGLKFDPAKGTISGTTTAVGTFTVEVTATNSAGSDSKKFSFKIAAGDGTEVLPCMTPRTVPVFADTPLGHKFYKEIDWMECMKYSTGWKQASGKPVYKPADNLSRAAMAAFIFRMEGDKNYKAPKVSPFADMKPGDKFYREISWMWEAKLSTGNKEASGKPTYRPNEDLSREAMAAFIYRLEAKSDASVKNFQAPKVSKLADMKPGMKFYKEIAWMYDAKLTTGNKVGSLREYWPKDKLSRQAMAAFIYRLVTDYRK